MKRAGLLLIFLTAFTISIFAEDIDQDKILQKFISDSIDGKYVRHYGISRSYREGVLNSVSISIYFESGSYKLKDDFNKAINEILLVELINNFPNIDISINTYYPFNILLVNNNNYDIEQKRQIEKDINVHGILIEEILNNAILGYFQDAYFASSIERAERVNNWISNSINEFLEGVYKYFGAENIVSFE